MLVFPKNAEKNASIIEKGLAKSGERKKVKINGKLKRSFLRASVLVSHGFAARPYACSRSTESIVMIVKIINCINGIKNTRKTSSEIGKCE